MILAIDSQILNNYLSCKRMMKYYNLEHLRPKQKAAALEKGGFLHEIFRYYYQGRMANLPHDESVKKSISDAVTKLQEENVSGMTVDEVRMVIKEASANLNLHKNDGWRPIAVEEKFSRLLFEDDEYQIFYEGIIDLVTDAPQIGTIAVDHKSSSRNNAIFGLNNQFIGYCWALGINHFIVNRVGFQTSLADTDKHVRILKSYSHAIIDEWQEDTISTAIELIKDMKDGIFKPNFTSCDKWSGCVFQSLCETTPDARDWKKKVDYIVGEKWDPMKRDEK